MSHETFTVVYDGPALRGGAMDVRDLAPALLAMGQLLDAANANLNGTHARINLQVRATGEGSFKIFLDLHQEWEALTKLFSNPEMSGATNLLAWILGGSSVTAGAGKSLFWLIKKLRGAQPDHAEKLPDNIMQITFEGETLTVSLDVLRLYQDLPVRSAAQKVVEDPLRKDGIDTFKVIMHGQEVTKVSKDEATYFAAPTLPDETLVDDLRRSAFSIISLAFKEDNKWRLYDGNTQISATIEDHDFLVRVDTNQISFSKGDILICDVRIKQMRTRDGLRTEYVVEKVIEHRPAARQLPLPLDGPRGK